MLSKLDRRHILAITLPVALMSGSSALAQTFHGTVSGRVTDATGAVVVGASLKLVNPATDTVLNDTSNKAGEFNFTELPVGWLSQHC